MRRFGLNCVVLGGCFFYATHSLAQSSLDILEQDLNQVKKEHQEAASQATMGFLTQLETASQSPDAALNLYQQAGGPLSDPIAVNSQHAYETPDEKATRLAQDQDNLSNLAYVLQVHCGLMRFAGLFIVHPDQKGLHGEWIAWLKTAAQIYPTLKGQETKPVAPRGGQTRGAGRGGAIADYRDVTMRDSIISNYLGFQGWGEKEQGHWKIKDLPQLYRANVLDPLRSSPSAETLTAWDAYIGMKSADQPDRDKWNQIDYPPLEFDRTSDDFAIARTTEKLATLVNILKANPTHPQLDDWIARVHQMVQDLRNQKAGKASSASAAGSSSSDVPVSISSNTTKS
jgi:hypothetical protein